MADNSKLKLEDNNMGTQKISVLDHLNGFQYSTNDKSDGFVIDMESFSNGINKDTNNANSRITLQRSVSRKGIQRGNEEKISCISTPSNDREIQSSNLVVSSSRGSSSPEKAMEGGQGTIDHSTNLSVHPQITITTANVCTTTTESKFSSRRNSFKRSWGRDPKRVLFLFASLSSMGTMLLIYLTLSMRKLNANETNL